MNRQQAKAISRQYRVLIAELAATYSRRVGYRVYARDELADAASRRIADLTEQREALVRDYPWLQHQVAHRVRAGDETGFRHDALRRQLDTLISRRDGALARSRAIHPSNRIAVAQLVKIADEAQFGIDRLLGRPRELTLEQALAETRRVLALSASRRAA